MKDKKLITFIICFIIGIMLGFLTLYLQNNMLTTTDIVIFKQLKLLCLTIQFLWGVDAIIMINPVVKEMVDDIKHYLNKK